MGEPIDTPTIALRVVEDDDGWTVFDTDVDDYEGDMIIGAPVAAWVAYLDAQEAMMVAHAELCAAVGFSTHGAIALIPCDTYKGESYDLGHRTLHDHCHICGHPWEVHPEVAQHG